MHARTHTLTRTHACTHAHIHAESNELRLQLATISESEQKGLAAQAKVASALEETMLQMGECSKSLSLKHDECSQLEAALRETHQRLEEQSCEAELWKKKAAELEKMSQDVDEVGVCEPGSWRLLFPSPYLTIKSSVELF